MTMADHLAADGFKDAGYQYINIDVSKVTELSVKQQKQGYLVVIFSPTQL